MSSSSLNELFKHPDHIIDKLLFCLIIKTFDLLFIWFNLLFLNLNHLFNHKFNDFIDFTNSFQRCQSSNTSK